MTWYQSQNQHSQWKKLLEQQNSNPNIANLVNSQQFCTQLIKHYNPQVMAWIQRNYSPFFDYLLTKCLVLPAECDDKDRKFRQPTHCIYLLCSLLDIMQTQQQQNVASSFINSSLMLQSINPNNNSNYSNNNESSKSPSSQAIEYVIDRMFTLYAQNDANKLDNTLLPGYFNRIFECLNRSHSALLTANLKTSQQGKLQKLLDTHGKFQQIVRCVQTILIVFVNQNGTNTNLQMSLIFSSASSSSLSPTQASPVPNYSAHPQQPNHPYETKSRLLLNILKKIKQYRKMDSIYLQNLMTLILQILKNVNLIFQGKLLSQRLCQTEHVKVFFQIAINGINNHDQDSTQCQIKCLLICKYCLILMTQIDRSNLINKFQQAINQIMRVNKPTRKISYILELINQWFLIQSGQNANVSMSSSLRGSMNSSLSNSFNNSFNNPKSTQLSLQIQQILSSTTIFQKLIKLCVSSPSSNIFHQRVANFILSVFKSQNQTILDTIFNQNNIIEQTITNTTNFKQNPYFGYFVAIIEIYATRRIDTPIVKEVIQRNALIWNKFYSEILEPYVTLKIKRDVKLGEYQNVPDAEPLQYEVVKKQQDFKKNGESGTGNKIQNLSSNKNKQQKVKIIQNLPTITPITLNAIQISDKQSEKQTEGQNLEPICLKFIKKQPQKSQNAQQKEKQKSQTQTQSFQSFLKKKMGQSNKLVDQRKKSRTPTKMISGESKRKKWGNNDQNDGPSPIKKSVSADQKPIIQKPHQQIIPKISFIKLAKSTKLSKEKRQRKINPQNDANLLKWMEKAKKNVKTVR